MKAILIREIKPTVDEALNSFQVSDVEVPKIKPNEVLVDVKASGCNFFDVLMAQGKYQFKPTLPFIAGGEYAGVISEIGSKVVNSGFSVGDHVYADSGGNAHCQKIATGPKALRKMPPGMSFYEAAGFGSANRTSYVGIKHRGQVKKGEYVLIHAAVGGVGIPAVQIAKSLGGIVIGTVGSDAKIEVAKRIGCDHVINYKKNPIFAPIIKKITKGHGVDVVYDAVGGDAFDQSTKCIAWKGRLVVCGFTSGRIPEIKANRILLKGISVVGLFLGRFIAEEPEAAAKMKDEVDQLYVDGVLKPQIYKVYPLHQAADAYRAIMSRKSYGKVIIDPTMNSSKL